ncbi:hypothetical protein BHE74_00005353, partial [Ensete ventricosum]
SVAAASRAEASRQVTTPRRGNAATLFLRGADKQKSVAALAAQRQRAASGLSPRNIINTLD